MASVDTVNHFRYLRNCTCHLLCPERGAFAVPFAEHEERFRDSTEVVSFLRDAFTNFANIRGSVLNYGDTELQLDLDEFIESLSNLSDTESQLIHEFIESLSNLSDTESQLIHEFIESLSNRMLEDGSTNWNLPPRFDVTPDESDDADDDADEMVQDNVADLPLIGLENESLYNLSNGEVQLITNFAESLSNLSIQMLEDGSNNFDLPPRFDDSQDEADNDADEMVQDYVADLPLEVHVVPDEAADVPHEAHVVPDDVANVPQEAHVVEDHVANSQRLCPICDNAIGVAFCCGHQFCVECGDRYSTCPVCRDRVHIRFRVF